MNRSSLHLRFRNIPYAELLRHLHEACGEECPINRLIRSWLPAVTHPFRIRTFTLNNPYRIYVRRHGSNVYAHVAELLKVGVELAGERFRHPACGAELVRYRRYLLTLLAYLARCYTVNVPPPSSSELTQLEHLVEFLPVVACRIFRTTRRRRTVRVVALERGKRFFLASIPYQPSY